MELPSSSVRGTARSPFPSTLVKRLALAATLLLGLPGAALGQSITFVESFIFGQSGETLDFNIETRDAMGLPAGGGTLTWNLDPGCAGRVLMNNPPSAPNITGQTLASVSTSRAVSCSLTVSWDDDNLPGTPEFVTPQPLFIEVDPLLTFNLLSGPDGGQVFPIGGVPEFQLQILDNGFPVDPGELALGIAVSIGGSDPMFFGDPCSPNVFLTGAGGIVDFGFGDVGGLLPLQASSYLINFSGNPPFCARATAAPKGLVPGLSVSFVAEPTQLTFAPEAPQQLTVGGGPQDFPVLLQTVGGTPLAGKDITWLAGPSSVVQPSSGNAQTDANGRAIIAIEAIGTDINGASLSAGYVHADGITPALQALLPFGTVQNGMTITPPDVSAVYTDDTAPGFQLFTFTNSGNTDDPAPGILVDLTITSGNGVFLPSGLATAQVTTGANGIAISPDVLIGRTNLDVTISANAGLHGTQSVSYPTALSTYSMNGVDPPGNAAQMVTGEALNLTVQLLRATDSVPNPMGAGETVIWSVSPNDGSSIGSPTLSGALGQASTQFTPAQATTYTITASFDPAIAGVIPATQAFTVDVAVGGTLTKPVDGSGDGQTGAPGSSLPIPLLVFARNNGVAAQGVTVNWSVQGDATLSANQTTSQADGSTSVIATLGQSSGTVQVTATRADDPTAQASFVLFSVAKTLTVVSGNNQSGDSGQALPLPLVVEARDEGVAVPGATIQWFVVSGDASLSDVQTTTDAGGRSSITVTLGQGGPVQIQAFRTDAPTVAANFSAASQAGAEVLEIVSGDGQTGTLTRDGEALSVRFLRNGSAIAGQTVAWQVLQGDATLSSQNSSTDASGLATTLPRFGTTVGSVVVRASAGSAVPVDFLLQAAAPELRLISGGGQSGPSGTRAAQPLVVALLDACCDAPLANEVITWQVVAGDVGLDAQSSTTSLQGQAENGLTFGSSGSFVLRASALNGLVSVDISGSSFTASISIVSGDGQTGLVESPLAEDFVIRISQAGAEKQFGNIAVDWQVIEGGGSLAAPSTLTDADGFAANRLTLGPNPGINRVRASLPSGQAIVLTATGEMPAGALVLVSGDGQTLPTNVDSAPLVVELRDGNGAPIANRTLVWSSENAELQAATSLTNSQGRAQNIARVLVPGAASVQVTTGQSDAPGVSFALNGGIANIPTLSPGQRQVARAMDSACELLSALTGSLSPEQADLLARCLELANSSGNDPLAVQDALGELSNDVGAAQVNAAFDALRGQFGNIQRRLSARRNETRGGFDVSGLGLQSGSSLLSLGLLGANDEAEPEVGADFGRWSFFASGMLGSGRQDPNAASRGFKFESTGLTAGVDYRVNPQIFVGAAIGYNRQDSDFRNDRGGMDSSGLSLTGYGSWYNDKNWYVDGVLTLGRNDYSVSRHINYTIPALGGGTTQVNQTARGKASGDLSSFSLSAGRDFQSGAWSYGSYLRGSLARADIDAYSERITGSGAGTGLGLAVDSRSFDSQTATLGGRLSYTSSRDWGILTPNLQFEWEHELKDDAQRVVSRFIHDPGNTPLVVDGDPLDRSYFNVGLGLSAIFPGGRSAFVFYEQLMGRSGQSQGTLSLGVRIEF